MVPQKSCWILNVGAHLVFAGWAPYTMDKREQFDTQTRTRESFQKIPSRSVYLKRVHMSQLRKMAFSNLLLRA